MIEPTQTPTTLEILSALVRATEIAEERRRATALAARHVAMAARHGACREAVRWPQDACGTGPHGDRAKLHITFIAPFQRCAR